MSTTTNQPRSGLPTLTPRIARLPFDDNGYPLPYYFDPEKSTAQERVLSLDRWRTCHNERKCIYCGQSLGRYVTFTIPAACVVNRIATQLPGHLDCSKWFMESSDRDEGVLCLWTCRGYSIEKQGYKMFINPQGDATIEIGKPDTVSWWIGNREATRDEILTAIDKGMPAARLACDGEALVEYQQEAHRKLDKAHERALRLLPKAPTPSIILP